MTSRGLGDIRTAFRLAVEGNMDVVTKAYSPFMEEVATGLESLGFSESLEAFDIPPGTRLLRARRSGMRGDVSTGVLAVGLT
ncbi:MAG: hypothetical protein Q8N53_16770, partial [Longimicrobiales bacterium]|nr:hypothetical protein [Longimicrobiales bacterium]